MTVRKKTKVLASVALALVGLSGCAFKDEVKPQKMETQSITIGNKANAIGQLKLKYSNSDYINGSEDIIIFFDKLPYKASFNNCISLYAENCHSDVYLYGSTNGDINMNANLVFMLEQKNLDTGLPITARLNSRWPLEWNKTIQNPTVERKIRGDNVLVEALEISVFKF